MAISTLLLTASLAIGATVASPSFSVPLKRAHDFEKAGKYRKAQKIYQNLLKDKRLSSDQLKAARQDYEDLNFKILFSRFESVNSVMHAVQPGESLYKIAKKYNTTVRLIKRSNGLKSDTIYSGMNLKVIQGAFSILVSKKENTLTLFLNGKPLKRYSVATGANSGTPSGEFKVANKLENPTWFKAGAVAVPGSPENALGTRWLGFNYRGYGIHGTIDPQSIGKQVTSGCVRMHNEEVEELYDLVPVGVKVTIVDLFLMPK